MVTTIILALAVLTAALVVGVFIIALIELDEIDEISGASRRGQSTSLIVQVPPGAAEAVEF